MTLKKELLNYIKSLGLEVHTSTKARGHLGFCLNNRIDISSKTPEERFISTLLHEFTHYSHQKLEKDIAKSGGTLKVLFNCNDTEKIREELLKVTNFVDENSKFEKLYNHKKQIKERISGLEKIIKLDYPKFQRSKNFKEFDKYIRHSKAKYLLKYDKIKLYGWFKLTHEIYSIDTIEHDFPTMPKAFAAYIRLKSYQKKQSRISARINSYKKYYAKPTELFARLVEGIYLNKQKTLELAPIASYRFLELLKSDYYFELKNIFELINHHYSLY